ncbi:CGNR zinc finger domain-containing protein [Bradyrhizobium prioriisuperbiae]|uniref:CGNR zinc finger domain-containing protein n=1 Tax=Bradyrhizobium prioriisuperbiae TaxID=2854389 RepID=UPI0028E93FCB|nr:ABATE domain-containing protein [Bradyrhizobium prioritasuperba]
MKTTTSADDDGHRNFHPLIEADHPALDLLNTIAQIDGQPRDALMSDADVGAWLIHGRWWSKQVLDNARTVGLLDAGRSLRETVRDLVARRKNGEAIDPSPLNRLMAQAASHPELVVDGAGMRLERRRGQDTPAQLLAPVAEAAADLLANGNFDLVRKCEDASCTLWFYDRTKSHRRRWCSMAVCGNRHKVAAFRKRRQG